MWVEKRYRAAIPVAISKTQLIDNVPIDMEAQALCYLETDDTVVWELTLSCV